MPYLALHVVLSFSLDLAHALSRSCRDQAFGYLSPRACRARPAVRAA